MGLASIAQGATMGHTVCHGRHPCPTMVEAQTQVIRPPQAQLYPLKRLLMGSYAVIKGINSDHDHMVVSGLLAFILFLPKAGHPGKIPVPPLLHIPL